MENTLGPAESIDNAFHRLGAEAIANIRGGVTASTAEGIHEARKSCKWLRATLRLLRSGLDADAAAREAGRIRRLARMLGTVRDATIRLISFRSLGIEGFEALEKQLEKEARAEHRQQMGVQGLEKLHKAVDSLERGWQGLQMKRGGWRHVGRGIERSYRRARKGFRRAKADPIDENLHAWRKRVKDLMYHTRLLQPIEPKKLGKLAKHLDDLGDWLGYDHDLIVLTHFIRKDGRLNATDREALLAEIKRHRKEHFTAARHVAGIIFQESPAKFTGRLEKWWDRWREN